MIEYRDSRIDRSIHALPETPSSIMDEGQALVLAGSRDGLITVKPSEGVAGELFYGVALWERRRTPVFYDVITYTIPDNFEATELNNDNGYGIYVSGTYVYVVDTMSSFVFAYLLSDGSYASGSSFMLDFENIDPRGAAGDGTTLWIVDNTRRIAFAYTLTTGARDSDRDITLSGNTNPVSASWISQSLIVGDNTPDSFTSYSTSPGSTFGDIEANLPVALTVPLNDAPLGIALSADTTRLYATFSDRIRGIFKADADTDAVSFDFDLDAANTNPLDVSVTSDTIYIVDGTARKVFAYTITADGMDAHGDRVAASDVDLETGNTVELSLDEYVPGTARITLNGTHHSDYSMVAVTRSGQVDLKNGLTVADPDADPAVAADSIRIEYGRKPTTKELDARVGTIIDENPLLKGAQVGVGREGIFHTTYFDITKEYTINGLLELAAGGNFMPQDTDATDTGGRNLNARVVFLPTRERPFLGVEIYRRANA